MPVSIPNFSDVGFADPRVVGALPSFPQDDPEVQAEGVLGAGLQKAGQAAETVDAYNKIGQNKVNSVLAQSALDGNLIRTKQAITTERDPAKIDALKASLRPYLDDASQIVTDPAARQLWVAQHSPKIAEAEALADAQQSKVYNDRFLAGSNQQLDDQANLAVQATNPADRETAQRNVGQIIGSLTAAGVISENNAQELTRHYGQSIITGTAHVMDANGQPQAALDFLKQNAQHVDPATLDSLTTMLQGRADRQGDRAYINSITGIADRGYGGNPGNAGGVVIGDGPGDGHVAPRADRVAFARDYAASKGINPDAVVATMAGEGLNTYTGDGGTSFGDFQLHTGGGSMGDQAVAAGINIKDPNTWRDQTKFAIDQMAANKDKGADWYAGQWHGAPSWAAQSFSQAGSSPSGGVINENTDPTLSAAIDNAPASGAQIPLDGSPGAAGGGAAPADAPASPTLAQLPDIDAKRAQIMDDLAAGRITQDRANAALSGVTSWYNHLQAAQANDRATLLRNLTNGAAMLADGRDFEYDPDLIRHFLPADKAGEVIQQLQDAKDAGQVVSTIPTASPADLDQQRNQLEAGLNDPNAPDYAKRRKMVTAFDQAVQQRNTQLIGPNADPVKYLKATNPLVQAKVAAIDSQDPSTYEDFATAALSEQSRLGVLPEQQHVLTAFAAERIADAIKADPTKAPEVIRSVAAQYGQAWPHAWNDLVTLGKLPAGYQVVGQLADYDPGSAAIMARALAVPDKDFRAFAGRHTEGVKSVQEVVTDQIGASDFVGQYEHSLLDSGSSVSQVVGIRHAIRDLAIGRAMFNQEDPTNATDKAIDAVVGHYQFMPSGGARVPVENYNAVTSNAKVMLNGLSSENVAVPPIFRSSPAAPAVEDYISMIKAAPTWITGPKADRLLLLDPMGRMVTDKMGNPVSVPFSLGAMIPPTAPAGLYDLMRQGAIP